jgi:hypothetical protein
LSSVVGRGRHEPNKPRVSNDVLTAQVVQLAKSYGVSFPDSNSAYSSQCTALFKAFMRLAPALVIVNDKPITIRGLCSFRLIRTKAGKRRLKASISPMVSKYLDNGFNPDNSSMGVLIDLLKIGKSKDSSGEDADYGY